MAGIAREETRNETVIELRCAHRKHGELTDRFVLMWCRTCSSLAGRPVFHPFDKQTGAMVEDEDTSDPD